MDKDICFTRYFYIKDEVEIALLMALLNKDINEATFWAYELYYSGFVQDFCNLIYKIYYDFYAICNITYEPCIRKHITKLLDDKPSVYKNGIVKAIIEDLIIRSFTPDVFVSRIINMLYENEIELLEDNIDLTKLGNLRKQIKMWIENKNYSSFASYILSINSFKELNRIYNTTVTILGVDKKTIKEFKIKYNVTDNIVILAHIFNLLITEHKKVVIVMDVEENYNNYDTVIPSSYKQLEILAKYNINKSNMLGIFSLVRNNYTHHQLLEHYNVNWLYYASHSPIWEERIKKYNGKIDKNNKTVIFENIDDEERFNDLYNYENDEQTMHTKMCSIANICDNTWQKFYKIFKLSIISEPIDELEEMNNDDIIY